MDSILTSPNLSISLLAISILATGFWYLLHWYDENSRRQFAQRNLKYVNMGNLFVDIILKRRIEQKKDLIIKKEGKLFGFNMLGRYTVLCAEPELIQTVVSKEFTNFTNRRPVNFSDPVFSKVLTLAQDDTWKRIRSVVTPTFSAGKLRALKPCIDDTVRTLVDNFDNAIKESSIVDIKQVVGAFTMDTIIQIAFGTKINSLVDQQNPIILHAKKVFSTDLTFENLVAFTAVFLCPSVARAFGLRVNRVPVDFFKKIALEVIKKKRAELVNKTESHSKASNFIELLLEAEVESSDASVPAKHKFITNDEIVAQCVLFFLVGYDTTATTITMVSYHLGLYPEVQERLFKEIQRVIPKLATESEEHETDPVKLITFESLSKFEYLNAVVNETLRLFGPLTFVERVAAKDMRVESADGKLWFDLKKDDIVHIPGYSVHRDPVHFPDPEKFDPNRFMTTEPTYHKYAYMPFGNGPRSCVAKSLALLEAKVAILHMVRNFKLSKCDQTKIPMELYYNSNLIIAKDVKLKVERRV